MASSPRDDRLFVSQGFRSYRKTYRPAEAGAGAATGLGLTLIAGWVVYRGANPDPELFDVGAALLADQPVVVVLDNARSPTSVVTGAVPAREDRTTQVLSSLTSDSWKLGKIGQFTPDNLYIKINGRAGFFKSFGVKSLHAATLTHAKGATIDIELYDMAQPKNALGAYNGERNPEILPKVSEAGTHHADRNALFVAQGNYYARLIGSDESEPLLAYLPTLLRQLQQELPRAELPWGHRFFLERFSLGRDQVAYIRENAFSFEFADDVFVARISALDAEFDTELFISARAGNPAARALAKKFESGFASQGKRLPADSQNLVLVKDEFLGSLSAAIAVDRWVVGVKGAQTATQAQTQLTKLRQELMTLPDALREAALPTADHTAGSDQASDTPNVDGLAPRSDDLSGDAPAATASPIPESEDVVEH